MGVYLFCTYPVLRLVASINNGATMPSTTQESPVEAIPDPEVVRRRLGECLRETKILRQLLRVAERAAKERYSHKGRNHERSS